MLKLLCLNKIENEEILERVNEERKLSKIEFMKMQYMCHIVRSNGLQRHILEGKKKEGENEEDQGIRGVDM